MSRMHPGRDMGSSDGVRTPRTLTRSRLTRGPPIAGGFRPDWSGDGTEHRTFVRGPGNTVAAGPSPSSRRPAMT